MSELPPIVWSTSLPGCPTAWSEQPIPVTIRTDMDVGIAKVRRRFTRVRRNVQARFIFRRESNVQPSELYGIFYTFFQADCMGGARVFKFRHPWSKQDMTWRWREPPSLNDYEVKFIQVTCMWEEM